jgi:hypothetical protein
MPSHPPSAAWAAARLDLTRIHPVHPDPHDAGTALVGHVGSQPPQPLPSATRAGKRAQGAQPSTQRRRSWPSSSRAWQHTCPAHTAANQDTNQPATQPGWQNHTDGETTDETNECRAPHASARKRHRHQRARHLQDRALARPPWPDPVAHQTCTTIRHRSNDQPDNDTQVTTRSATYMNNPANRPTPDAAKSRHLATTDPSLPVRAPPRRHTARYPLAPLHYKSPQPPASCSNNSCSSSRQPVAGSSRQARFSSQGLLPAVSYKTYSIVLY